MKTVWAVVERHRFSPVAVYETKEDAEHYIENNVDPRRELDARECDWCPTVEECPLGWSTQVSVRWDPCGERKIKQERCSLRSDLKATVKDSCGHWYATAYAESKEESLFKAVRLIDSAIDEWIARKRKCDGVETD